MHTHTALDESTLLLSDYFTRSSHTHFSPSCSRCSIPLNLWRGRASLVLLLPALFHSIINIFTEPPTSPLNPSSHLSRSTLMGPILNPHHVETTSEPLRSKPLAPSANASKQRIMRLLLIQPQPRLQSIPMISLLKQPYLHMFEKRIRPIRSIVFTSGYRSPSLPTISQSTPPPLTPISISLLSLILSSRSERV
jgi:hypothetical protein